MRDTKELQDQAYKHFRLGIYTPTEICEMLDINYNTLMSWKRRGNWTELTGIKKVTIALDARLQFLISKEGKNDKDYREVKVLGDELRKNELAIVKAERYQAKGSTRDSDFNPKLKTHGRKSNKQKNYLSPENIEQLEKAFLAETQRYGHQKTWYENRHRRTRNIMKSRQIGATYYFALESIVDAAKRGINKNFLSASRSQALLFRAYIVAFVYREIGIELKGDPIVLRTDDHVDVDLRFLSASSNSAQGPHGDIITDEYMWHRDFERLRKVSSAIATQKMYKKVYISTPSTVNHPAYKFWSGEHINRGRRKDKQVHFDISHKSLKKGRLCEDHQWRQVVTLQDAIDQGFDRIDKDELEMEYAPDEYDQLFNCKFIDDTDSVFKFEEMQKCGIDPSTRWSDYDADSDRPFGNQPVWIGFDPSRTIDAAACAVVAPPSTPGGKFRVLEKYSWRGASFEYQANRIEELTHRFNVKEIAIDSTGLGHGVFEEVRKFFRRVKAIHYSQSVKADLVMKGKDVIANKRLEYNAGWSEVSKSFMMIYKTSTDTGSITYKATRTADTGHADIAFAILHALSFEPLGRRVRKTRVSRRNKDNERKNPQNSRIQARKARRTRRNEQSIGVSRRILERGILRNAPQFSGIGRCQNRYSLSRIRNGREAANADVYHQSNSSRPYRSRRGGKPDRRPAVVRQLLSA